MTPLRLWFRSALRRRRRSFIALVILVGVAGGIVMGSAAGAERTDTAYTRFLKFADSFDTVVQAVPFPLDIEAIRKLPEVEEAVNSPYAFINPAPGEPERELSPILMPDLRTVKADNSKILEGRRPDPDKVDEASVSTVAARVGKIEVGSTLRLQAWTPEAATALLQGDRSPPNGVKVAVKVVGIEVFAGNLLPSEQDEGTLHLTPAFAKKYGDGIGQVDLLRVKLRRGQADIASFKAGVERISDGRTVQFLNLADDTVQVQRAIHLQAVALLLFAVLAGIATLLILGQALARDTFVDAADQPTLAALGLTPRQRWLGLMLRPAATALGGAVVAMAVAVSGSPLTPFGIARDAEPDPGFAFDAFRVLGGATLIFVLLLLVVAFPAWRVARAAVQPGSRRTERPSRLAEALARAGGRPSAVTGLRMAVEPGRTGSVPTRAALAGTILSLMALVTTFTFGTSLQNLIEEPRLYGWNWDALVGDVFFEDLAEQVVPPLSEAESVAGFSTITLTEADVGGVRVPTFGFESNSGSVFPPIVSGRAPEQSDEIVLGATTMGDAGKSIGDTVTVRVGDNLVKMRIVGRGVLPALSGGDIAGLGEGALITGDGLARLVPRAARNLFAVRFAEGASEKQKGEVLGQFEEGASVNMASPPKRVADFDRVNDLPEVLAGLLIVIGAATLVHTLVSAVRRRRRDLAILRTLGFVKAQVRWTVACQATTLTVFALGVGVPLGAAAGRSAWGIFANELGIVPEPVIPLLPVLLTIPVAILIANAVALLPGRTAARTRPAVVLRTE